MPLLTWLRIYCKNNRHQDSIMYENMKEDKKETKSERREEEGRRPDIGVKDKGGGRQRRNTCRCECRREVRK